MTKRDALRIVRRICRDYEAGYDDDSLVLVLQAEITRVDAQLARAAASRQRDRTKKMYEGIET